MVFRPTFRRVSAPAALLTLTLGLTLLIALRVLYPQEQALSYALYGLLAVFVIPAMIFALQWSGLLGRRVSVRLKVRRARVVFRSALSDARRHPELADTDRLHQAAHDLVRYLPAAHTLPEVVAAAQHPYAPIRKAGLVVVQAAAVRSARLGKV
ncbi:MAG: hypothetical protein ACYTFT_00135 [Planctomycetota bacterium]